MNRRRFLATTAGTASVVLAGCSGDGGRAEVTEDDVAVTVTIDDREFDPMIVDIDAGQAVEWENVDDERYHLDSHDINGQGTPWSWDAQVPPGETVAYLFEDPGVYGYFDRGATSFVMCGAVAVGDPSPDDVPQLPCE